MMALDEIRKPPQSAKARRSRRTRGQRKANRAITSHATHSCADDDLVLVQRAKNGDRSAFDVLVQRYRRKIAASINRRYMRLHPSEADDLAQEVFIKAYRGLHLFRSGSSFNTWLYRIASNTALNAVAAMKMRPMDYLGRTRIARRPPLLHWIDDNLPNDITEPGLLGRPYCGERYQNMVLHLYSPGINGQRFKDQRTQSLRRPELCDGTKYGHVMHVSRSPQRGGPV
jgi:RNA polymerase sigma factor (sigma-70 family)